MADGEPEGYELIHGTGAISTLELDEDWEPAERIPFGFRAPVRAQPLPGVPVLTGEAWGDWLP